MTEPISQRITFSPKAAPEASGRHILLRCFGFLRPYWRLTVGAYIAALAINGLAVVVPQVIRWIVDQGIAGGQANLLVWAIAGMLGLTIVKGILGYFLGVWSERASQSVAYDVRNAIHRKLGSLSFSYHDQAQTGQLLSRSIQDVERIRFLTGRAVLRLFQSITLLFGTVIALLWMNPRLALLSLATMPLLAYVAFRFGRVFRPLSIEIQQQLAVLTTVLEQNLRGSRIVKAFAQEDAEIRRFETENNLWFDLSARAIRAQSINVPLIDFIASLSTVLIIWYGGSMVIQDALTLGELVAFTTYLSQLVEPVRRLGVIIPAIAMASAAGERIFEILDAESEVQEAPDAVALPPVQGQVGFEHVSFAYFGRKRVLTDLNFDVQPGQIIALLGKTGSGKSTVMNLLLRFYDPTAGLITIDGHDIRGVTLTSLRDQIGIVLQETTLFATSIRENIAFGTQHASEADVIAAAQAAQAHDFIMEMPDGYDTHVGERGTTLSGGQKQRVAIARALLKDPRILLLDDATSSVDTETERLIQMAFERLMQGRTSFVIAQRLSTVRLADLVLVLDEGRIVARGTHEELLHSSGLYAEIYHRQLR
ncbi:MAG: ABC transporter ATP-binding protein/permease [Anaerolineae bacterium]|nr:ABC transporter ATP-binding protein/permease [Anaerolineae bacterium]